MVRSATHNQLALSAAVVIGTLAMVAMIVTPVRAEDPLQASINIRTVSPTGERLAGAVYAIAGVEGTFTSDADGKACVIGFADDSIWEVTQLSAPDGYDLADPVTQMVEVDDDGDCNSPDAVFVNARTQPATPSPTPPGAVGPGQSPNPTSRIPPRDDTLGGNPGPSVVTPPVDQLPDTATPAGPSLPIVVLFAGLMVGSIVSLARTAVTTGRHR